MLQVGVVDLVNPTAILTNAIPHAARKLDHVLRAKSFPTAPMRGDSLRATSKSNSISEKVVVLIPLHHHLALTLRDKRQRQRGDPGPTGMQLDGTEVGCGEENVEEVPPSLGQFK
jgi:hypothetical protein